MLVAEKRRSLTARLEALEQEVLSTKTALNEIAWPTRIPAELLLRIFKFVRDEWLAHADELLLVERLKYHLRDPPSYYSHNAWIRITHVCCHWRRTALADPSLWTQLRPYSPVCNVAFIRRSQRMPLSVTMFMHDEDNSLDMMLFILQHSSRIRSLRIRYSCASHTRFEDWGSYDFSQLRSLDLSHKRSPPFIRLTDRLPSLDKIRLSHYPLPTVLSVVVTQSQSLTHVVLEDCSALRACTWTKFFEALEEVAPRLQELALRAALPHDKDIIPERAKIPSLCPPIPLPRLRNLVLDGKSLDCSIALRHLSIPPSATVTLTCHCALTLAYQNPPVPNKDDMGVLLGAVEHALTSNVLGPPPRFDTLSFTVINNFIAFHAEVFSARDAKDASQSGHLTLILSQCQYLHGIIEHSVDSALWRDVEYLYIDPCIHRSNFEYWNQEYVLPEGSWRAVLSCFPKLQELSVPDRGEASLLRALQPRDVALCPALKVLRLRCVWLKDDPPETPYEASMPPSKLRRRNYLTKQEWIDAMGGILDARRALRLAPLQLSIHHGLQDPAPLYQLAEHGTRVELLDEDDQDHGRGRIPEVVGGDSNCDDLGSESGSSVAVSDSSDEDM
ncbi:hypothetical protein PsYK624_099950 [Phanerochaete sordida]|uniref:F-box domain-containing protein n=1 Tax=Phanerochaete sordida TaxID=48140 RepID=A0A9P3GF82_9APHY|nr:hypothetical protein PsYK624_099950 [Phanerochaete sordida]